MCHQLVQIIIYTIQHMSKSVCISLLEGRDVKRGMHIRLYTHACETAMPKKGMFVDVIIFEIVLNATVFWLRLHFWKLGWIPFPIGKLMEVWQLKHQVVHIYMNTSKRKIQKEQSLVL